VNWNWDPRSWRTSTKLLLGGVTLWPIIYIGLFIVLIFSGFLFGAFLSQHQRPNRTDLDLIQLEKKIQNGEIKELRITSTRIEAIDRSNRSFETYVNNDSTREEIIRQARQLDSNQHPRVDKIVDENSSEPPLSPIFPIGFVLFFVCHMLTILLMFVLMPLYIILAVKDERHDQTTRIIWVVLLATVGMLANPVYWYLYVWRKAEPLADPLSSAL
jgi:ATP-dependent Zn protease